MDEVASTADAIAKHPGVKKAKAKYLEPFPDRCHDRAQQVAGHLCAHLCSVIWAGEQTPMSERPNVVLCAFGVLQARFDFYVALDLKPDDFLELVDYDEEDDD